MKNKINYRKIFLISITAIFLVTLFSFPKNIFAAPADDFVTTWKTDNPGTSNSTSITIPTTGVGYNYDVDWNNDGVFDEFGLMGNVTHNFGVAGTYTIRIQGTFPRIYFALGGDAQKILSVDQWGTIVWSSMNYAFAGALNLVINASDAPNLSSATDISYMFYGATSVDQDISDWDVSNIIYMNRMFFQASSFNNDGQPLTWGTMTGNVVRMNGMFEQATSFNQDISDWDVSNVEYMQDMFLGATSFDQDISSWDVGNVIDMNDMFGFTPFNQDISSWDVSRVANMSYMFAYTTSFDQNLGSWNIENVTNMDSMFEEVTLSTSNYDSLLNNWGLQSLQTGVIFDGGNSKYCNSTIQRQSIIDTYDWTIYDDGFDCSDSQNPTVITGDATSIESTRVILSGSITDVDEYILTDRGFEYGLDIDYGLFAIENSDEDPEEGEYSLNVLAISCDTTYHYRAFAFSENFGFTYGEDRTFTTLECSDEYDSISFDWAGGANSEDGEAEAFSVKTDEEGNSYILGNFWGTIDFDPGVEDYELTSSSYGNSNSFFILKLNKDGDFVFAKQLGQESEESFSLFWNPIYNSSLTLDQNNNIYIIGNLSGTIDFDLGEGVHEVTSHNGNEDLAFILKLDEDGNFITVFLFQSFDLDVSGQIIPNSIFVDQEGNIYTAGYFDGTADFDPLGATYLLSSDDDLHLNSAGFISKIDASGNLIFAKRLAPSISYGFAMANSIVVDNIGDIFTVGKFSGTIDFDPSFIENYELVDEQGRPMFISKLDSSGNFVFAKQIGGVSSNYFDPYFVFNDENNFIYIVGLFSGVADFDPSEEIYELESGDNGSAFILKLDEGGDFIFAQKLGSEIGLENTQSRAFSADLDNDNNIYITGLFGGALDFDPSEEVYELVGSPESSFLLKLSEDGDFIFAKAIIPVPNYFEIYSYDIEVDQDNNIFIVGGFNGEVDFDLSESESYIVGSEESENFSAFVVKLTQTEEEEEDHEIPEGIIKLSNDEEVINLNLMNSKTISSNGDYIVFVSIAEVGEGAVDSGIYLYDRQTQEIERIGEAPEGEGTDFMASISNNGQYVAIISGYSFFNTEAEGNILYLYDRESGENRIIATNEEIPLEAGAGFISVSDSGDIVISADFYLAMMAFMFIENGEPFPPGFPVPNIYFYNNQDQEISIIAEINEDQVPYSAKITADGQEIIYNTVKPDFEEEDIASLNFTYNIDSEETQEIEINSEIETSNFFFGSSISSDGRFMASIDIEEFFGNPEEFFESFLLIIYDRQLNQYSTFPLYDYIANYTSFSEESYQVLSLINTDISNDGRYVVLSFPTLVDLEMEELNLPILIYDNLTEESVIYGGENSFTSASISGDGRYITFTSDDNLTDDDNDNLFDVFIFNNPFYEEPESPEPPHTNPSTSTGTSVAVIAQFQQEQYERAIDAGLIADPTQPPQEDDACLPGYIYSPITGIPCPKEEPQQPKVIPPKITPPKTDNPSIINPVVEPENDNPLQEEEKVEEPIKQEEIPTTTNEEVNGQTNSILGALFEELKLAYLNLEPKIFDFLNNLINQIIIGTIALVGLFAGIATNIAGMMFANPITFAEIKFIPIKLWNAFMLLFGFRKRSKPWGTVYDSVTKQPLDPAYVILEDLNGKEISTCITDLDGRYGFLVPAGTYRLKANKTHYEFPSKKLAGKSEDVLYDNLYFNEVIEVKDEEVLIKNIPMDPLNFDWNEFAKQDRNLMKFFKKRQIWIAVISDIFFVLGFVLSSISLIYNPSIWNICLFTLYILIYIISHTLVKPKVFGKVTYKDTDIPLSYAILRFFYPNSENQATFKVADKTGRYYCLIPNGNYRTNIENKNSDESYSLVYSNPLVEVKKGYVDEKFEI